MTRRVDVHHDQGSGHESREIDARCRHLRDVARALRMLARVDDHHRGAGRVRMVGSQSLPNANEATPNHRVDGGTRGLCHPRMKPR